MSVIIINVYEHQMYCDLFTVGPLSHGKLMLSNVEMSLIPALKIALMYHHINRIVQTIK